MQKNNKRLLFLTTRLFWPADSGRKVVLWNYCEGIANQLGYKIYLYSFLEAGQTEIDEISKPDFVKEVHFASNINKSKQISAVSANLLFHKDRPLQCGLFCDETNFKRFREYCKKIKPEIVIVDMIRLAPYISAIADLPCKKIINFDDLLSERYTKQYLETSQASMLGKYSGKVTKITSAVAQIRPIRQYVLKEEARRCRVSEDKYAHEYDASLLISPMEGAELKRRTGLKGIFVATMGAKAYEYIGEDRRDIKYDCGFVGNFGVSANQDSLDFIVNEILPLIPGVTLRAIGVCPDELSRKYEHERFLSFSRRVDEIRDELLKCKIFLAPIKYGSGIKTKILEAMGIGIPVVSNEVGFEGIAVRHGIECLKANNPQEFAGAVRSLLKDESLRRKVGEAGVEFVRVKHDWKSSIINIKSCIDYATRSKQH